MGARTPDEMFDAMRRVVSDRKLYERLQANAIHKAMDCRWEYALEKL